MIVSYTIPKHSPIRFETDADTIVIGRRPTPDQSVDIDLEADDFVSRMHACISHEEGQYWIRDLDSINGTWVNGMAIQEKTILSPDTSITIGYTIFNVQMTFDADAQSRSHEIGQTIGNDSNQENSRDQEIVETTAIASDLPPSGIEKISSGIDPTLINPDFSGPETVLHEPPSEPLPEKSDPAPIGVGDPKDEEHTTINPDFSDDIESPPLATEDPEMEKTISTDHVPPPSQEMSSTMVNPYLSPADENRLTPEIEDATLINPEMAGQPDMDVTPVADETLATGIDGYIVDPVDMTLHSFSMTGKDAMEGVLLQGLHQLRAFNEMIQALMSARGLNGWVDVLGADLQKTVPNAFQGALVLPDEKGDLQVRARWPGEKVPVSMTWARKAFEDAEAFVWAASAEDILRKDLPASAAYHIIQSAVYLPMVAGADRIGVLYVDNYYDREAFSATDLEILKAVACQMAMILKA